MCICAFFKETISYSKITKRSFPIFKGVLRSISVIVIDFHLDVSFWELEHPSFLALETHWSEPLFRPIRKLWHGELTAADSSAPASLPLASAVFLPSTLSCSASALPELSRNPREFIHEWELTSFWGLNLSKYELWLFPRRTFPPYVSWDRVSPRGPGWLWTHCALKLGLSLQRPCLSLLRADRARMHTIPHHKGLEIFTHFLRIISRYILVLVATITKNNSIIFKLFFNVVLRMSMIL